MPRYYCDYCDTYLTHDSPSVRKQHNQGYKHKSNVRNYFQQFEEQQTQNLIDQKVREHLGQTGVFPQVGAAFNQHLASLQYRPPIFRPPTLPVPGSTAAPMRLPAFSPPVFPTHMVTSGPIPTFRPPVAPIPVSTSQGSIVPIVSTFYTTANAAYFNGPVDASAISVGAYQQQTLTLPPSSSSVGVYSSSVPAESENGITQPVVLL